MSHTQFILHELFSWRAALDILLISAGFFYLYRTFVRLGTWKIVVGAATAFLVFIFARLLHLDGIEWIFQTVSQVAVLALIVIFQPELRKILEKIVSLYGHKSNPTDQSLTQIVAESLWQLAQKKQGAIIVYPGKEPVAERLSGGHKLSANASLPLIVSIFDPNSPGHDGALIIENNLLSSFGVRLPISQTSRLDEQYGTRHHAAMGLAEVTDALVLVVSEERGAISAFHNGRMTILKSAQDIFDSVTDHQTRFTMLDLEKTSIMDRRTTMQSLGSLVLATIFWIVLASTNKQIIERSFTLPIDYIQSTKDLILVGDRIEEARIRVAGSHSAIDDFALDNVSLQIDISNMVEGKQVVLIDKDLVKANNVSFVSSTPAQLEINLAKITKKMLPVVPQLVGSLPKNLTLKNVYVHPAEVEVLAPSQAKNEKPPTISTTPVYLNSIQSDSRIFCKIIAPSIIQPAVKPWQDVEVIIEIEQINNSSTRPLGKSTE